MNIGSLFVELGVKGGTMAISQVGSLHKGLRDTALIANQTVQMMSKLYGATKDIVKENASLGKELSNTSAELDISTDRLQRWDYAARLSGAQVGEMDSAFRSLQSSLLGIRDNDVPEYFQYLFAQMDKVDKNFDAKKFLSGDLDYAMESIRNLAKNGEYDLARLNAALSSLGFSNGISTFLKLSDVKLGSISKDLIIPKGSIQDLDKMYEGLIQIEQISRTAFADFAKVFDKQLISDIGQMVKELATLLKEVVVFAKESGLIKTASTITQAASSQTRGLGDIVSGKTSVSESFMQGVDFWGQQFSPFLDAAKNSAQMAWNDRGSIIANIVNNLTVDSNDPTDILNATSNGTQQGMNDAMGQMFPERGNTNLRAAR